MTHGCDSPADVSVGGYWVLRETDPQATIWELLLPEVVRRLPTEVAAVESYVDDERFLASRRHGGLVGTSWDRQCVQGNGVSALVTLLTSCGSATRFRIICPAPTWRLDGESTTEALDHPGDPTGPVWIHLDRRRLRREQPRSVWSRPDRRRAPGYGSGGWGFESLAARQICSSEAIKQEKRETGRFWQCQSLSARHSQRAPLIATRPWPRRFSQGWREATLGRRSCAAQPSLTVAYQTRSAAWIRASLTREKRR